MNRTARIILGIFVFAIAACVCLWVVIRAATRYLTSSTIVDDPTRVREIATSFPTYKLPTGYREHSAVDFFMGKLVMIGPETQPLPGTPSQAFLIMQIPYAADVSEADLRAQLQRSMTARNLRANQDLHLVEEGVIQIRSHQVALLTYEGQDEQGVPMRWVYTGIFHAGNADVMLAFVGPVSGWDQEAVDYFVNSIR
jgi:hypothetical protein